MNEHKLQALSLIEVESLLLQFGVSVEPSNRDNPIVVAANIGIISLVEIARECTGTFNRDDQRQMIVEGKIVCPIAFGQQVLQASIEVTNEI